MTEYRILAEDMHTLRTYVRRSMETLQQMEQRVLELEGGECSAQYLPEILKDIHYIKGGASFIGIAEITAFGHTMEGLLGSFLQKEKALTPAAVTALLNCCDVLGELLAVVQQGDGTASDEPQCFVITVSPDMERVTDQVQDILSQMTEPAASPEIPTTGVALAAGSEAELSGDKALLAVLQGESGQNILENFFLEAEEHMEVLADQLLLHVDDHRGDGEAVADLFRRFHTLKSLLGVVLSVKLADTNLCQTLKELQNVFHTTETVLARVQNGEINVSDRMIKLCFAAIDGLRRFQHNYCSGGSLDAENILAEWRQANTRDIDRGEKPTLTEKTPPATTEQPTLRPAVLASHTIRVSEDKLNRMMNIVGEMAIGKNAFQQIYHKLMMEHNLPSVAREVKDAGLWVARMSSELEDSVMGMRMSEIKGLFQKFPRVIRDIAQQTGKEIALIMEGEATELDKSILEQISDPLMHLVRNAADHGVEPTAARLAAGKAAQGKITLRAFNRGKHVIIEVEDDGRGMDAAAIRAKALEKEFVSDEQLSRMSDQQVLQLVFLPGLSTAKAVSDISGRGVGMDVVKTNVVALKGKIQLDSEVGRGSRVTIQLPLTLAVSKGLLVEAAGQSFIIPLEYIEETVKLPRENILQRKGKRLFYHRGSVVGMAPLSELIGMERQSAEPTAVPVILVTDGLVRIGLAVDRLRNEQDILIKPLPEYLSAIPGMGGATILGDGRVALVLNPLEIIQLAIAE